LKFVRSGFTLVEMLVAMVLVSLLIGVALFAFRSQLIMIKKAKTSGIDMVLSFNQLRSSLQSMKYYVVDDYDAFGNDMKKLHFYFNGTKKEIDYITTNPLFSKNVAVVKLTCKDKELIYQEEPLYGRINFLKPQVLDDSKKLVLYKRLKSCDFFFFKNSKKLQTLKDEIPNSVYVDIKSNFIFPLHINIKSDNNATLGIIYNAMYPQQQ